MTDILSQLQSATEGSRELSDDVIRLLGWRERYAHEGGILLPDMWVAPNGDQFSGRDRPDPTTNLQDAVSLVPEQCDWIVSRITDLVTMRRGYTAVLECLDGTGDFERPMHMAREAEVIAGNPALALCIAIIEAHESKAEAA